jgi:Leucine-rich repeat (LRR) protein
MRFKTTKNGPSKQLMELGPATGMWSDAVLELFLGNQERGWPAKFAKVDGVYFHWGEEVTHFAGFAALPNLKRVWGVSGALQSLDGLEHCKKLEYASFPWGDDTGVKTLAPLEGMSELRKLRIKKFTKLSNIDALASMKNLRVLDFGYAEKVKSLAPIGKATNLEVLSLYGWKLAKHDLGELAGLSKLRYLDLTAQGLTDVSALAKLPSLEKVRVYGYEVKKLKGHAKLAGKLVDGENGVADFDDEELTCDE